MDVKNYIAAVGAPWAWTVAQQFDEFWTIASSGDIEASVRSMRAGSPRHKLEGEVRYIFFLNWSQIVPKEVTDAYECVNFHCTALPYGRGGHPIENLILRGHEETVITAHRMTEVIDGGPVYTVSGPVSLAGTKAEILGRFVGPVAGMIRMIIDREPEPIPQYWRDTDPVFKRLPQDELDAVWAKAGRQAC